MLVTVSGLLGVGIGVVFLVVIEILDWQGRMEVIEKRWPAIWRTINNRAARLVLLVVATVFLTRDFRDAVAVAPPPQVIFSPKLPPPGQLPISSGPTRTGVARLTVLYHNQKLNGQIITMEANTSSFRIDPIQARNDGNKKTDGAPTVRLYFSEMVTSTSANGWQNITNDDRDFVSAVFWGAGAPISRGETWETTPFSGNALTNFYGTVLTHNGGVHIRVRAKIFYGGTGPAQADFSVTPTSQ